jgi:hypothetical protein
MRAGLATFWLLMAALELSRRWTPTAVGWLGGAGPWLVVGATLAPAVRAAREWRDRRPVEAVKAALWTIPGLITLLAGPEWLRF